MHVCARSAGATAASIIDVTYVDDEALFFAAHSARDLRKYMSIVIETLTLVFKSFGLIVNFAPGKTEFMCAFKGKHAKFFKEQIDCSPIAKAVGADALPHIAVDVPVIGNVF